MPLHTGFLEKHYEIYNFSPKTGVSYRFGTNLGDRHRFSAVFGINKKSLTAKNAKHAKEIRISLYEGFAFLSVLCGFLHMVTAYGDSHRFLRLRFGTLLLV